MDEIFSTQYSLTDLEHHSHLSFFFFNISLMNERKSTQEQKLITVISSQQTKEIDPSIKHSSIKRGKRPQGRSQIK